MWHLTISPQLFELTSFVVQCWVIVATLSMHHASYFLAFPASGSPCVSILFPGLIMRNIVSSDLRVYSGPRVRLSECWPKRGEEFSGGFLYDFMAVLFVDSLATRAVLISDSPDLPQTFVYYHELSVSISAPVVGRTVAAILIAKCRDCFFKLKKFLYPIGVCGLLHIISG